MARLGDVFPLVRNGASIKQTDGAAGIPITRIETISNREIDRNKFGYADIIDDSKYKDYILQDGDILMSHINSEKHLGKVALYKKQGNEQIIHGMNLLMLRANPSVLFPPFAIYFFETSAFLLQIKKITKKSVNQASFTVKSLKEVEIPLPPIDEQRKIAAVLDKVSDLIAKRKQQLDKLDELVKSRFIEMFIGKGYPTKTVNEVSRGKGEYGAQSASTEYDPNRPRYVRITDINDDGTLNNDMVTSVNLDDDEQYRLEYGDFMFARMGATVGKTYAFIVGNQIFAGYLIRYKLNPKLINPRYLFWYTKLDEYWNWVKLNQSGAAQPGINAKKYGSLRIPVPPMELQDQFAAFVAQTDKSKLAIQESLKRLEILKKSLMQKYFG